MRVFPLIAACPQKQQRQLYLFKSFGCPIYQDRSGCLYVVLEPGTPALMPWVNLAVEAERIPRAWQLVSAADLPGVGYRTTTAAYARD